jgi:hypothetical protein
MNLREYERESIRRFVESVADAGHLKGRVLDFGCGKQPYREIVEATGEYVPYDRRHFPANVSGEDVGEEPWPGTDDFDAILCTQVVQYAEFPADLLRAFKFRSKLLVMTYPTAWPEVEAEDRWRFTKAGMQWMLTRAGFTILRHEARGSVWDPRFDVGSNKRVTATGEEFVLGYGVVARA